MVEFRTTLDSEKTQILNRNTLKRMWWLFVLCSGAFIAFGAAGLLLGEDEADRFSAIFLIVLGVLFTPLCFALAHWMQKKLNKSAAYISDDTLEVYTFDEEKITIVQTKGDELSVSTQAKYSYLYKVLENKDYYFLYISRAQCHVIDKESVTQGTLDEMNELLSARLGSKFKHKSRRKAL